MPTVPEGVQAPQVSIPIRYPEHYAEESRGEIAKIVGEKYGSHAQNEVVPPQDQPPLTDEMLAAHGLNTQEVRKETPLEAEVKHTEERRKGPLAWARKQILMRRGRMVVADRPGVVTDLQKEKANKKMEKYGIHDPVLDNDLPKAA